MNYLSGTNENIYFEATFEAAFQILNWNANRKNLSASWK